MDFEKELKVERTNIPGLIVFDLPVHGDNRGWFKENWQRAKMTALGLPDFGPVQNNISFNAKKGVTRGIHAEPWDKYISIATGAVFGAWVDLRPGESFGQVYTTRLDPSKAIYVPRGVGNSFQALEDGTAYTYLVNAHWSLEQKKTYTFVNLADPELDIQWPIPLEESERSEADLHHPMLRDARPMAPRRTLVTGCNSQLGHAIRDYVDEHGLEGFEFNDIDTFDFSDPAQYGRLTFTRDMAEAIFHLLDSGAPFGTYNLTGSDAVRSWADIAREVFSIRPTATATRCARSRPRSTSRTRRPRSARVRRIPPCRSPRSRTPGTTRRIGRKPSRHTSPRNLASKA